MKKLLLISVFTLQSIFSFSQNVHEIIASYFETIGGKNWETVNGVCMTANVDQGGMTIPVEVVSMRDGRSFTKLTFMGSTMTVSAFDGHISWETDFESMEPKQLPAEDIENARQSSYEFPNSLLAYKKLGYTPIFIGFENVNNIDCYKIKLEKKTFIVDGKELPNIEFYYIDKVLNLPILIENEVLFGENKGKISQTRFSNYREVDGVYFPFSISQGFKYEEFENINFNKIETNPNVNNRMFTIPRNQNSVSELNISKKYISDKELIKLFDVSIKELGSDFVDISNSSSMEFEILGKKSGMLGEDNFLLAALQISNPNLLGEFGVYRTVQVGLFKFIEGRWILADIIKEIGKPYSWCGFGEMETFELFGQNNECISIYGQCYHFQEGISESRMVIGIINNMLQIIYSDEKSNSLENEYGTVTRETQISFIPTQSGFYQLKETKLSDKQVISSKILNFNIQTNSYSETTEIEKTKKMDCGPGQLRVEWSDPDQSGTSIRNSPGGTVIAKINPSDFPDGCIMEIVEMSNGWFKISGSIQGPENEINLPNSEGWIHNSVITVGTRNYGGQKINILDAPGTGSVVGTINSESHGLKILDLCGSWVKIQINGLIGWVSADWLCGNPWTTCN
jgi:hypothetical protein